MDSFVDGKISPKWYAFVSLSCVGAFWCIFYKHIGVIVDEIFILLFVFLSYITINSAISDFVFFEISTFTAAILLYIFLKNNLLLSRTFEFIFLSAALLQAVYALLQYLMIFPTYDTFKVLGAYDNPAGLAANLAFIMPLILLFAKEYKYLAISYVVIVLIVIVLSESRAGLLSVLFIIGIYLYKRFLSKKLLNKSILTISFLLVALFIGIYLFYLKEN